MNGEDGADGAESAAESSNHYVDKLVRLSDDDFLSGLTVEATNASNTAGYYYGSIFDESLLSVLAEEDRPCVISSVVPGAQADLEGLVPGDALFLPMPAGPNREGPVEKAGRFVSAYTAGGIFVFCVD
mmetsp:Transcript_14767/g.42500  ORF Transcript_14767/g.42500 Transcript_14767/m.42500 type:complete len:128 (-) Transcript_14767:1044-1427(-)